MHLHTNETGRCTGRGIFVDRTAQLRPSRRAIIRRRLAYTPDVRSDSVPHPLGCVRGDFAPDCLLPRHTLRRVLPATECIPQKGDATLHSEVLVCVIVALALHLFD